MHPSLPPRLALSFALAALACAPACRRRTEPAASTEPPPALDAARRSHSAYRSAPVAHGGALTGHVRWDGPRPTIAPVPVAAGAAPEVCATGLAVPVLRIDPQGGVANAVVSLAGVTQGKAPDANPPLIDQRACQFVPHVTAAFIDTPLRFGASDPDVFHNVHGVYGYRTDELWFNRVTPAGGTLTADADREGVHTLYCDAGHPWMIAFVLEFPHPYFAVTDAAGRFELAQVPPGNYRVRLWHEGVTPGANDANGRPTYGPALEAEGDVSIAPDGSTTSDWALDARGFRAAR